DDAELISTLDPRDGNTLAAIEKLQAQLLIRQQEAREFRSWESSMLAIGSPEALEVVEETRVTFTGAIQVIPPAPPKDAEVVTPPTEFFESTDDDELDDSITDVVPPVAPVDSPRTGPADIILVAEEGERSARVFQPETAAVEPPLPEQRTGTAFRLFWL